MAGGSNSEFFFIVDDLYFSALHDADEIFTISDEKYAQELQLQEALISSSSPNQNISTVSSSKQILMTSSESTKSPYSFCDICMDTKTASEMFQNANNVCGHLFCTDCIRQHVAAKIKENLTTVKCPDPRCKAAHKFYCPFRDCSAMLVDDGGVAVTSSECPNCHRLFCAQCKVAWHCGMSCIEFQSLKKGERSPDDILLFVSRQITIDS
ncbi:hypothetical protein L1987_47789 [Smallanthus sonchifolius]|uniref:Uncharacterized protein n=1 Tax=Smallanthus sonchifolius TaxID=185202 RepID=A0ACB9FPR4_9ASTR|nr:hypothetical protein L1987_47789 [Smallanthus sonchifolius]